MLKLLDVNDDQFRIAMETVGRMGVCKTMSKNLLSDKEKENYKDVEGEDVHIFFQSCYVVKIDGHYFLVNYKEILGKEMKDSDHARTNTIATLLDNWGIVKIANKDDIDKYGTQPTIFVIPHKAKNKYQVKGKIPNYKIAKFISNLKEQQSKNK